MPSLRESLSTQWGLTSFVNCLEKVPSLSRGTLIWSSPEEVLSLFFEYPFPLLVWVSELGLHKILYAS